MGGKKPSEFAGKSPLEVIVNVEQPPRGRYVIFDLTRNQLLKENSEGPASFVAPVSQERSAINNINYCPDFFVARPTIIYVGPRFLDIDYGSITIQYKEAESEEIHCYDLIPIRYIKAGMSSGKITLNFKKVFYAGEVISASVTAGEKLIESDFNARKQTIRFDSIENAVIHCKYKPEIN